MGFFFDMKIHHKILQINNFNGFIVLRCRKTVAEYLEQVQKLRDDDNITTDMNSYTIFMNLLGKVLKRLTQQESKNQIMKIIGKTLNE